MSNFNIKIAIILLLANIILNDDNQKPKQVPFQTNMTKADDNVYTWATQFKKVDCGSGGALSKMRLTRGSGTEVAYSGICIDYKIGINADKVTKKYTPFNDLDSNHKRTLIYLDRHNVFCESNQILKSFTMEGQGNKIRYVYECVEAEVQNCVTHRTSDNAIGDSLGELIFLDRHTIGATNSASIWSVLQSFRLARNASDTSGSSDSGKIFYYYTKCELKDMLSRGGCMATPENKVVCA